MLTKLSKDDRAYMLSHVPASDGRTALAHAIVFPYLGVQVMDGAVWSLWRRLKSPARAAIET